MWISTGPLFNMFIWSKVIIQTSLCNSCQYWLNQSTKHITFLETMAVEIDTKIPSPSPSRGISCRFFWPDPYPFKPGSIGWTGTGWTGTACTAWSTGSCWVSGGTRNFTTRIGPKDQSRTVHGCRLYVYLTTWKTIIKLYQNQPSMQVNTPDMDGMGVVLFQSWCQCFVYM